MVGAGIVTGYGLDDQEVGVRVPVGAKIFSFPCRPDWFWGPPSLVSKGYRGYSGRGVKLTTHLQLVPMSRKHGSIHPLPHSPSWRSSYLVKRRDNFKEIVYEDVGWTHLARDRIQWPTA
jgi:hypothetical protein